MKIKAKWGFIGDAKKLGVESPRVHAGQVFEKVNAEYGHNLVGKGLVEEIVNEDKPKPKKPAAPKTKKPAGPNETKPAAPPVTTAPTPAQGELTPAADTPTEGTTQAAEGTTEPATTEADPKPDGNE